MRNILEGDGVIKGALPVGDGVMEGAVLVETTGDIKDTSNGVNSNNRL